MRLEIWLSDPLATTRGHSMSWEGAPSNPDKGKDKSSFFILCLSLFVEGIFY